MARVILLEKIDSLGDLGQQVDVKDGYAWNYLVPQGKAVPADKKWIAEFEKKRTELQRIAEEKLAAARVRASALSDRIVTIVVKAGEEGRLYGSVGLSDLVREARAAGIVIEKSEISLPNGPLRRLGDYEVAIKFHSNVTALLKVKLISE